MIRSRARGAWLLERSRAAARRAALALACALLASCASPPSQAPLRSAPIAPAAAPSAPPGAMAPLTGNGLRLQPASFDDLPGWQADDFGNVWSAWLQDCRAPVPQLAAACAAARGVAADDIAAQRAFFEQWFQPWQAASVNGQDQGLVTGYYEPVFRGSRTRGWPYVVPIYGLPGDLLARPDAPDGITRGRIAWSNGRKELLPYWSRAQVSADPQALAALGRHVVAWLDSAVDALFLQVQGSGLVELPDGHMLRLSYAGDNGWPYKSVGRWLLEQGELRGTVTMQIIRAWAQMHPNRLPQMLDANPRMVFFHATPLEHPGRGPIGAMGVPLTPMRSVAVDKRLLTLGTPLWLATNVAGQPFTRLVFAQDVGGAITGSLRADLFFGTGDAAGDAAGRMQSPGRMWVLLPRGVAP
ncbi:murein transglycosylase A [Thiomonas sp. FB-Cd]|uniref:murein transglycosylase A n=1 Tax=Thiomonas sp. FB-Cd TaxID=1158292 RepID=UPI0006891E99|nr:MltA domain-containing protein [Thiomonas sp. FB-Cd]